MRQAIEPATFLPSLHLVRGLCAIGVALYHFLSWSSDWAISSMGTFGVYTFFTLSALVLLHNDAAMFSTGISAKDLRHFYRKRIARILPLLAFAAVAAMLFAMLRHHSSLSSVWQQTFLTASGLFALHMPGMISFTTGAWSLGIEIAFYALFPVLALLSADMKTRDLVAVFLVLMVAQQALFSILPQSTDPTFWGSYTMPLIFAPFFAGGFVVSRLGGKPNALNLWLCLACLAALFGYSIVLPGNVLVPGVQYVALTVLAVGTVAFAYRAAIPKWLAGVATFLGNISYSLYLTHWFAYQAAEAWLPRWFLLPGFILFASLLALAAMVLIEEPARKLLSSGARRSPTTPQHSAAE